MEETLGSLLNKKLESLQKFSPNRRYYQRPGAVDRWVHGADADADRFRSHNSIARRLPHRDVGVSSDWMFELTH